MEPLLEAKNVCLSFGGLKALDEISLRIKNGEIVGMIGPNGSGKTTFINVLTRIYSPISGRVFFKGQEIEHLPIHRITEIGIARTFQNLRIFKNVTVLDNVLIGYHRKIDTNIFNVMLRPFNARKKDDVARTKAMELLKSVGLDHKAKEYAKNLPYGELRRLEVARALATDPTLLLLDEPTAGMNPKENGDMIELLKKINLAGISIFIIEHNMKTMMNVANRIVVLNAGRLIFEGTPAEVQKNERVQEIYLGKEETD